MHLKLTGIFKYLEATPNSRCFIEGEAVLEAEHILLCGIKKMTDQEITILAYCLQTSGIKKDPHEITGTLKKLGVIIEIESFECSCKAGASRRCKHIAATLLFCSRLYECDGFYLMNLPIRKGVYLLALATASNFCRICLNHNVTLKVVAVSFVFCYYRNSVEDLEILSSTDQKSYWKCRKPKAEAQYLPRPLCETECFNNKVYEPIKHNVTDLQKVLFSKLERACPNSALSLHLKGRRIVPEAETLSMSAKVSENTKHVEEIIANADNSDFLNSLSINTQLENVCCGSILELLQNEDRLESASCKQGSDVWKSKRLKRITGVKQHIFSSRSKLISWLNLLQEQVAIPFSLTKSKIGSKKQNVSFNHLISTLQKRWSTATNKSLMQKKVS